MFFTKRLHGLWDVPYTARLHILNVQSLKERRLHNDMIIMYKLYDSILNLNVNDMIIMYKLYDSILNLNVNDMIIMYKLYDSILNLNVNDFFVRGIQCF